MTRILSALIAVTVLLSPLASHTVAQAQESGRLDLVDQTIFVGDDDVQIVLRANGAPDTAQLRITICRPRTTRERVRNAHEARPQSGCDVSLVSCDLSGLCAGGQATIEVSTGGLITVTLLNELIGEGLRRLPGALPFIVELLAADGAVLDTLSTSLIVMDSATEGTMTVSLLADLLTPVALQTDGSRDLDVDQLLARQSRLDARPDVPIAVEVQPETIDALGRIDPTAAEALVTTLGPRELLVHPWISIDEESWRLVGRRDLVISQYSRGNGLFESTLARQPSGVARPDADATAATLGLLRSIGASGVVVTDDQVSATTVDDSEFSPFQLLDDNLVPIIATRIDGALTSTLLDPDPELGAVRALAELAVAVMESPEARGTVLDFNAIDPVTLDVVLDGIEAHPSLQLGTIDELLTLPLARSDAQTLIRGQLTPVDAPAVGSIAADLSAATTSVDALASMIDPEPQPVAGMRERLQAALSSDLTADAALAYTSGVLDDVVAGTTGIEVAPSDRVTLTDRRTELPFTIINRQPVPLNVDVVLSAEKLRFPNGDELSLRLRPGANDLLIEVETLASGDARVTATLTSPGGLFELGEGTIDIRSTALSGLGLVISIVALLVLGAWWVRTILRIRRNRSAATVAT